MPFPDIDPVAFSIGPFAVHWYALSYIAGLVLGLILILRLIRNRDFWGPEGAPVGEGDVHDFLVWAALGAILGGRLGYILFYNPAYFLANPEMIAAIWRGGMAFHGGMLGVIVAAFLFARRRKIGFLSLTDLLALAVPIGLFLGRLANFVNGELWGRVTDVPWGVVFPGGGLEPRHPSQLYEAVLEGPLLFLLLWLAVRFWGSLRHPGLTSGLFLILYGGARIVAELFREPDAHIGFLAGGLTMGIALSAPMILGGVGLAAWTARRSI